MDQVVRMGVEEIFGWKRTEKNTVEQKEHDEKVQKYLHMNFMDFPTCLPKIEDEKINLFDGSISVIRFDDFLKNETPDKY